MNEIWKLYLSRFIYGVGVLSTFTFTLYFLSNGLSQSQISILYTVFFFATALFEIPTGGFADTYGHKASYALGFIIEAFYYLIFFMFPNFWGILIGMIVAALGVSLQSGANTALTYEILNKEGKSDDFVKVDGRINSFGDVAVILTAPLGLILYKYQPALPYLISFFLVLLAGVIVLWVKYEFRAPAPTTKQYFSQIKTGVLLTLENRRLLFLSLIWIVTLTSSYALSQNISAPLQLEMGVDLTGIGFTQSLISIGFVIMNLVSYRIIQKIGGSNSLILSVLFAVVTLLVLSQINAFWGAGFIVLFMMVHSLRCQVLAGLEQKEYTSAQRSTMASTKNTIMTLCAAILMPIWGLSVDQSGLRMTLVFLAIFILVVGLIGSFMYRRSLEKDQSSIV